MYLDLGKDHNNIIHNGLDNFKKIPNTGSKIFLSKYNIVRSSAMNNGFRP